MSCNFMPCKLGPSISCPSFSAPPFCCLWRNVEASCHKHFVVFSGNQHRRLLPAMFHNLRDGGRPPTTAFTTPACCSINTGSQARYMLRIAISTYRTCIRRPSYGGSCRNIAMPFGMAKLEWRGYPMVKNFDDTFIRFDMIHERDRHRDRRTDRHHMTT